MLRKHRLHAPSVTPFVLLIRGHESVARFGRNQYRERKRAGSGSTPTFELGDTLARDETRSYRAVGETERMTDEQSKSDSASESPSPSSEQTIWQNPDIPVGDAPPVGKIPLVLFSLAWVGWLVFLAMMI